MAAVRGSHTTLELMFRKRLQERGLAFEYQCKDLPGKPDFVNRQRRVIIFVDSCFWHGCKQHGQIPRVNQDFWVRKITRNRQRDREVTKALTDAGWRVFRIWEHSIRNPRAMNWWLTCIEKAVKGKQGREL